MSDIVSVINGKTAIVQTEVFISERYTLEPPNLQLLREPKLDNEAIQPRRESMPA
jgi:hypothetical protein